MFQSLAVIAAMLTGLGTASTAWADDDLGGLPPGAGDEDVFYTCSACHSINLVLQHRLSQRVWGEIIDTMIADHGMPPPDQEERQALLTYLSAKLGVTGYATDDSIPLSRTPYGPLLSLSPD